MCYNFASKKRRDVFLVSTYRFLTPEKLRAVITSIINISQSYGGKTNAAPGKRHIVGQCNNKDLFNKIIISHLEAEGNRRNIWHVVKMFRLLTKNIL